MLFSEAAVCCRYRKLIVSEPASANVLIDLKPSNMTETPQQPMTGADSDGGSDELQKLREEITAARAEIKRLEQRVHEYPEQLEQEVRERTRELEAVNRIAATVGRSLELNVILRDSLAKVLEVLEVRVGAVFLTDDEKGELNLMVHQGLPDDVVEEMKVTPLGENCPGVVALKGELLVVQDIQEDSHPNIPIEGHPEFKSMAGVPLESKGRVRGVLCLLSRKPERFAEKDLKLLVTIGSEIGVAIENAWLYEKSYAHSKKMEELSITDSLTNLFNRRFFYRRLKEEMARAKRQKHSVSLLVVDLDNLKEYNDAHGHLKGDEALRGVAQAITNSIRQDVDSGFRYGGDEFAVILPYSDSDEAGEVAERIRKTFEDFGLEGTSLSIGLAELDFEEEVDDFVSRADSAMYISKNSGGNQVHKA
ncbi:MAG: sensor domain-containing diguanylate cyclase [Thermoleophilia bacterium]